MCSIKHPVVGTVALPKGIKLITHPCIHDDTRLLAYEHLMDQVVDKDFAESAAMLNASRDLKIYCFHVRNKLKAQLVFA